MKQFSQWTLTDEGKTVASNGSHEAQVFNAVPSTGSILHSEIMASIKSNSLISQRYIEVHLFCFLLFHNTNLFLHLLTF